MIIILKWKTSQCLQTLANIQTDFGSDPNILQFKASAIHLLNFLQFL